MGKVSWWVSYNIKSLTSKVKNRKLANYEVTEGKGPPPENLPKSYIITDITKFYTNTAFKIKFEFLQLSGVADP